MGEVLVGTSGWSYVEWVGPFYKEEKGMLKFYSSIFSSTEVNSTFYALPPKWMAFNWIKNTSEGFLFSLKIPRQITHKLKLENAEKSLNEFLSLIDPLAKKGRLGAFLIQLPPKQERDTEKLESFLSILPEKFSFAVEFRHLSWLEEEVFKILEKYNVSYTVVDEPLLPPLVKVTSDFSYVRFHGRGRKYWYNYLYLEKELKEWVPRIEDLKNQVKRVYVYFNNHFKGYAPKNALELLNMLGTPLNKEMRDVKNRLDKWFETGEVVVRPILTKLPSKGKIGLKELLEVFTDRRRLERARKIENGEVRFLKADENLIEGKVKDYTVIIDLKNKVLSHDCADWGKVCLKKLFCKHVAAFFLNMKTKKSKQTLMKIYEERGDWKFKPL